MTSPNPDDRSGAADAASDWRRRRRIDEVFGDDLPSDDRKPGEKPHSSRDRRWYDENKPPHHG